MKVIQLNAWLGRLNGALVRFLRDEDADIVCLQEAYLPNPDILSSLADQYNFVDEIMQNTSLKYSSFAKNWAFKLAEATVIEGNVIMSKYPITNESSLHTHGAFHLRERDLEISNTRIWQSCHIQLPSLKIISIGNYQGYLTGKNPIGDDVTINTIEKILTEVSHLSKPIIICGDFNISPDSPAMKVFERSGLINLSSRFKVKTTLSSVHRAPLADRNSVTCDYIFISEDIVVKYFQVSEHIVSDHKALILEFDL